MRKLIVFFLVLFSLFTQGQSTYWQQEVDYKMNINFDVENHQFAGNQVLTYTNNSPDTLYRAFWHLYFNAFQPGSMMDVRNHTNGRDSRYVRSVSGLKENEIGYQKILSLRQGESNLVFSIQNTILEVVLDNPILPGSSTTFYMEFEAQVPFITRRAGRDNTEDIDYTMSQWFPKMAQYDRNGWHAHPYIDSEFYAPFGNYEVNITIDKKYVLAGTGILQNPNEIGCGYEQDGSKVAKTKGATKTWKFKAKNVHDFVWAADPDYKHLVKKLDDGRILRFFYVEHLDTENWEYLPDMTAKIFNFMDKKVGKYEYPQYSVIQAGHGGMEYPMATLITGHRSLQSLLGVTAHEVAHSWFHTIVATNENNHAWMDEGFANYYTATIMPNLLSHYEEKRSLEEAYRTYMQAARYPGFEEPLTTHADHFTNPNSRNWAIYTKGSIVLAQLNYILGEETFNKAMKRYFNEWKFKHPDTNDFKRVMEKSSGLELDWYFDYMINTTYTIDYEIEGVSDENGKAIIRLKKKGIVPMPVEFTITKTDGSKSNYYAPLDLMRGEKPTNANILPDWRWTNPYYLLQLDIPTSEIERVEIDESGWMADINRTNNVWNR